MRKRSSPNGTEFRVSVEYARGLKGNHEIMCTSFIRKNKLICFSLYSTRKLTVMLEMQLPGKLNKITSIT
jgi:hypothetical protein